MELCVFVGRKIGDGCRKIKLESKIEMPNIGGLEVSKCNRNYN